MQRLAEFLGERDRTEVTGKGLVDWMMEYLPSLARRQDAVELAQCLVWVRGAASGQGRVWGCCERCSSPTRRPPRRTA